MIARPNFAYQGDVAYMPPSDGYHYIWLMVDEMSLYTILFPLRELSAKAIRRCIDRFLMFMPKFAILKTDYGSENSKSLTLHLAEYNILHYNSVPNRSAQQGIVERHIRTVKNLINKFIANNGTMNRNNWVKIIPYVSQCINKTEVHHSGLSRYDLIFSLADCCPCDRMGQL